MLFNLLTYLSNVFFLLLHITGAGAFPKALSKEEEKALLERNGKGDKAARKKLIEHNLRLVAHVIKKYYRQENDQEDLISIGTIGLIKAVDSFDKNKNIKFSSYASKCIENEVLMYFRRCNKTMQDISLDDPIENDKDGSLLTIMDTVQVEDTVIEDIDNKINSKKMYEILKSALDDRERRIIILRYGLMGVKPLPQREIAKKFGISRSYVSRIEKTAIEKLRSGFKRM